MRSRMRIQKPKKTYLFLSSAVPVQLKGSKQAMSVLKEVEILSLERLYQTSPEEAIFSNYKVQIDSLKIINIQPQTVDKELLTTQALQTTNQPLFLHKILARATMSSHIKMFSTKISSEIVRLAQWPVLTLTKLRLKVEVNVMGQILRIMNSKK